MERSESGATFRRHSAELDIGRHMHAASLRHTAAMVAAATLVAAMLDSQALAGWVFNLPLWLGPVRDVLLAVADAWHSAMAALGLDQVHPALREAFHALRER